MIRSDREQDDEQGNDPRAQTPGPAPEPLRRPGWQQPHQIGDQPQDPRSRDLVSRDPGFQYPKSQYPESQYQGRRSGGRGPREPAINAPSVVLWTMAVLAGAHFLRLMLPEGRDLQVLFSFGFIPIRITEGDGVFGSAPFLFGEAGRWLSFVTHTLIHGDAMHLIGNTFLLLAFGAPVARRVGALRYILMFLICATAGALAHLLVDPRGDIPVVGASGAISGLMGAAARFMFAHRAVTSLGWPQTVAVPLAPLTDRRVLGFAAVWTAINLVIAFTGMSFFGENQLIAWDAHLGGFFAGLLIMPLMDPFRPGGVRG